MIRHVLAPVRRDAAHALALPRTLAGAAGVALTFDDGPHPEGTPAVLDALARAGARATFFMIGEQVARRPALAARVAAEGHAVALHGHVHRLQPRMGPRAVRADIARGLAAIQDACGAVRGGPEGGAGGAVRWHRPPYGIYSPAGLAAARAAGLQPLLWSRWGKDWRRFTTAPRIAARVLHGLLPGDVILLHDADFYSARGSHRRTAAALELIAVELRRRGIGTVLAV